MSASAKESAFSIHFFHFFSNLCPRFTKLWNHFLFHAIFLFCHHYQTHDRFHSHLSTLIQPIEQLSILSPHKCERICGNSFLRFSDAEILLNKSHLLRRPILSSYVEQVWRPHPHPAMVRRSAPTKQMFFIWPKPKNLHTKKALHKQNSPLLIFATFTFGHENCWDIQKIVHLLPGWHIAQCSRCQVGCSGCQNFRCISGSCYRSILSKIRVWKSQKPIFLMVDKIDHLRLIWACSILSNFKLTAGALCIAVQYFFDVLCLGN